jgi:acyl-CoA synthetase (AMP-forming)/AMP-acid ligase II
MTTHIGHLFEPLSGRAWSPEEIGWRLRDRCEILGKQGLIAGDRVFLHYGNALEFFIDVLAIWQLGACAVPLDSRLTAFEVSTLAEFARPRFSIWGEMPDDSVVRRLANIGVASLAKADEPSRDDLAAGLPRPRLRLDDEALILFTSGTTGNPKGVVHTHRSLRARLSSLVAALGCEPYRRTLCLLPTHFGHGLICNCLFPWLNGQDLYVLPAFRADVLVQLGELVDRHAITFLSSVPTVWRLVIKAARPPKARSLKRIHCGSAPLSAGLWQSIQKWSGIPDVMNTYGITETASWLAGTTTGFETPQDGFIGPAWGGEIKVLPTADPDLSPVWAEPCKPGDGGHVWVNTPALMMGYLNRDDLTSAVITDGWFYTGDIGYVDDRGYLHLRGRQREEINKGGMKVYPDDIDAVIENFAGILDVCAFAYPDALLGEDVGVAVVMSSCNDDVLVRLYDWAKHHLAPSQLPKRWYVLSEIPRTSRGKVDRADVARRCDSAKPINFARLLGT